MFSQTFLDTFKASNIDQIKHCFPDRKHHFGDSLKSLANRIVHLLKTGTWISETKLSSYIRSHIDEHISDQFQNKGIFRKLRRIEAGMVVTEKSRFENIKDGVLFIKRFIQSPITVGSITPSSSRLAKAIVRQIPKTLDNTPKYILEVGPGTGSFTDKIIKRMNPNDVLHLVEYDADFYAQLKEKYKDIPNIKIFKGSIAEFDPQEHLELPKDVKYQYIVSGLPFNSFDEAFVDQIFKKYENLIGDGGKISYFEYILIPTIKKVFMSKAGKGNLNNILKKKKAFFKANEGKVDRVWRNMTPAKAIHHCVRPIAIAASAA